MLKNSFVYRVIKAWNSLPKTVCEGGSGGSTSGQQWALPPPPSLIVCPPPPVVLLQFFLLKHYCPYTMWPNGVDGWKRLEITIERMN